MDGDDDIQQQGGAGSSREYNFSDDFNISEVKDAGDTSDPTPISANGTLPASLTEAVDKSLSQIAKPAAGINPQTPVSATAPAPFTPTPPMRQPGASINILEQQIQPEPKPDPKPVSPGIAGATRPDPFREPITKLDNEWPFASPETLARHRDREKEPFEMPQKKADVPTDLPVGEAAAPVPPKTPAYSVPPLSSFIRPASMPPVPPPTRPGLGSNQVVPPRPAVVPPVPSTSPVRPGANTASATPANQTPGAGQHPGGLKNIRTYESDVADALAARPITKTSMAIAESKKRGEGEVITSGQTVIMPAAKPMNIPSRVAQSGLTVELEEKSHLGWKIAIVILSLILIGGGVIGGYYLYSQSPLAAVPVVPSAPATAKQTPALVPYDTQAVITIDGANNAEIMRRINAEISKPMASSTLKEIVLTETRETKTYRATAAETILLAGVPVPDMIARTLNHEWMLGVYSDTSAKRTPFIVVHTNLFQNAFAGMLAWEPSMVRDLQPFLGIPYDKPAPKGSFRDQIVKNKDVRAFVATDDSTIFEYSFIDNSTLVITGDNPTLAAIISRLDGRAFVR